jgi:hypothetical protein
MTEEQDPELSAIQTIMNTLGPLDTEARQRVLTYVFQRLNLPLAIRARLTSNENDPVQSASTTSSQSSQLLSGIDIRTLKEDKAPSSATEMVALVAYYLAEAAPIDERKNTINKDDVAKYFKQAGYPLPKVITQALPNAARSGYFDITGGGRYRLNPVGYNLVVHGLPTKRTSK